ncbi:MAG: hypothetical protein HYY95_27655 [Candidatus Rokubacteria bacterium]|nr:hypothetical protein [Candidatus Rokubacteria bacterium]MBI3109305.1 hypothetical protein [Candidatus Rokubacteria bacterium]
MRAGPDALLDLFDAAVADAGLALRDAVVARRAYLSGADDLEGSAIPPGIEALIAPAPPAIAWAEERRRDANHDAK